MPSLVKNKKIYRLQDLFGDFLWGRMLAIELRDNILKDAPEKAFIDFDGVDFITRAFADEFLKVRRLLEQKNMTVELEHVAPMVSSMFTHAQTPTILSKPGRH